MFDEFPEQQAEVKEVIDGVVEEQNERYAEYTEEEDPMWEYTVESHSDGPAVVLYSATKDRPNAGGQFIEPLIEAGYVVSAVKDQSTEDEGTRIFLERIETFTEEAPDDEEPANENILQAADGTVGQRAQEYGPPTENFRAIADMWSGYLGVEITPYDYSQMMILAKIGRTKTGNPDRDTHQDQAGYSLTTSLVNQDGSEPGPYYGGDDE